MAGIGGFYSVLSENLASMDCRPPDLEICGLFKQKIAEEE